MKRKKLKIAIFHLGFFFSGGGEKLVLEEAEELIKRGHDVSLFAPVIDRIDCFPDIIKRIEVQSLFFPFSFNFPLRDFVSIVGAIAFTPLTFFRFKKYDVFFGANQPGPLICFFLSKLLNKPYIIYLSQPTRLLYPRKVDLEKGFGKGSFNVFYLITKIFRPLIFHLDKISIRGANTILSNGEYMKNIIEEVYHIETISCPAGCHMQGKSYKEKRITPFILTTNRHFPQKRLDYAILFLKEIIKIYPQILLVITGATTAYTQKLKNLVKKFKLDNKVVFTNLISEKKLKNLYSKATVYIYTSPEEDFGMGIIEAMGAGTPVIAWKKAGPATTIINGKTGYLITPYKKQEFINKIILLIKDKKKNILMGKQAKIHVNKNYTFAKHNDILEDELLKALDK